MKEQLAAMPMPPPSDEPERLLSIREAAAYLGVSPKTVWRWCHNAQLPAFKQGGEWRIHPAVLATLLAERREREKRGRG